MLDRNQAKNARSAKINRNWLGKPFSSATYYLPSIPEKNFWRHVRKQFLPAEHACKNRTASSTAGSKYSAALTWELIPRSSDVAAGALPK